MRPIGNKVGAVYAVKFMLNQWLHQGKIESTTKSLILATRKKTGHWDNTKDQNNVLRHNPKMGVPVFKPTELSRSRSQNLT